MIHRTARFLIGAALLATPLSAQETAEEILARAVQAAGGRESLIAARSLRLTGRLSIRGVPQGPVVVELKDHERLRAEVSSSPGDRIGIFDGTNAWQIRPGFGDSALEPLPAALARDIADVLDVAGPIVDWQERGFRLRLAGRETVDFLRPDGSVRTLSVDSETGLRLRWDATAGAENRLIRLGMEMSDYQLVDGIAVPFCLRVGAKGDRPQIVVEWSRIEINPDLDDIWFVASR